MMSMAIAVGETVSMSQVARELGVDVEVISGVVKAKRLRTHKGCRPLYRGIDRETFEIIKRALAPEGEPGSAETA